ncbi:hypothetical protein M422DRAFT_783307 [Sphaerobolus stellatus SS14]|uniref:Uncharacterized protein n=1 Tax=Sphaerobolus stellatus (strain SS14) TaxID=990650 RepID=A0A0C9UDZ2_SPHS4|nr:hypothetical protein M422DRAFT_783307 [Sphaerobolus stellatus SS14]
MDLTRSEQATTAAAGAVNPHPTPVTTAAANIFERPRPTQDDSEPAVSPIGENGEKDEEAKEEIAALAAVGTGIYNPPDWDFQPFVKNHHRAVWSLHPNGILYLASHISQYDKLEAAQGVPLNVYEKRLSNVRLKWKRALTSSYMDHWPAFNYKSLLGPNPSKEELKTAKNRVLTKIDNLLGRCQRTPEKASDLLSLLFHTVHRIAAKDLWAREDPLYPTLEKQAIEEAKLDKANPQKFFTEWMKIRASLFKGLSVSNQVAWRAKVQELKNIEPPIEDLIAALARLFAMIGDVLIARLGWYVEIRAAGLGLDEIALYFIEKYRPQKAGVIIDYGIFEDSVGYDSVFEGKVAGAFKVELKELVRLAPYKLRMPDVDTKRPAFELRISVHFDEEGNITSEETDVCVALTSYMENTFGLFVHHIECTNLPNMAIAMVPAAQSGWRKKPKKPEWNEIARADDVSQWIEPSRLPPSPFELGNPMSMKKGRLYELATHVIRGELGPRERTTVTHEDGEDIDINQISSSDSEEDEDEEQADVKQKRKPAATDARAGGAGKITTKRNRGDQDDQKHPPLKKSKQIHKDIEQPAPVKRRPALGMKVLAEEKVAVKVVLAKTAALKAKTATPKAQAQAPEKVAEEKVAVMVAPVKTATPKASAEEKAALKVVREGRVVPKPSSKAHHAKREDSDSEDHPIVVRRKPARPFNGDFTKWYHDVVERVRVLDWEVWEGGGDMGEDFMSCVRFLEASEVDTGIELTSQLDASAPIRPNDEDSDAVNKLWDTLMQPTEAMPTPSAYRGIKQWQPVYATILECAQGVIAAIMQHPTETGGGRLMVGGPLGIFCTLRGVEFMRRCIAVLTLAREQFRRWGVRSFEDGCRDDRGRRYKGIRDVYTAWAVWMEAVMHSDGTPDGWWKCHWTDGLPDIVNVSAEDAFRRQRGFEPTDLLLSLELHNWKRLEVSPQIKAWSARMDEAMLMASCVVEKFLWTHALYMVAGVGGQQKKEWCVEALTKTRNWLGKVTNTLEPSLLGQRDELFEVNVTADETSGKALAEPDAENLCDIEGYSSATAAAEDVIMAVRRKKPLEEGAKKGGPPMSQAQMRTSARLGSKPPSMAGSVKGTPLKRKAPAVNRGAKKVKIEDTVPEE